MSMNRQRIRLSEVQSMFSQKAGSVSEGSDTDEFHFTSSSGICMSLIMEKIFGGMKNRCMKEGTDDDISEADSGNTDKFTLWMDNEMDRCLSRKNCAKNGRKRYSGTGFPVYNLCIPSTERKQGSWKCGRYLSHKSE